MKLKNRFDSSLREWQFAVFVIINFTLKVEYATLLSKTHKKVEHKVIMY